MAALATVSDVQARLSRTLTSEEAARVYVLLDDASAAVRAFTGQDVAREVSTDRLAVRKINRRLFVVLPQRPTNDVTAIVDINGNTVTFEWDGRARVELTGRNGTTFADDLEEELRYVDVTYDHGYDDDNDPRGRLDAVAGVVANVAARAFGTPADETGKTSETISQYSYQVGSAAASGGFGLLATEKRLLVAMFSTRRGGTIPL